MPGTVSGEGSALNVAVVCGIDAARLLAAVALTDPSAETTRTGDHGPDQNAQPSSLANSKNCPCRMPRPSHTVGIFGRFFEPACSPVSTMQP